MPSLKGIRSRIHSVKNTQKITKAMKLVAAARLRRAQDAMNAQRPYAKRLRDVIVDIIARTSADGGDAGDLHPLLAPRAPKKLRLLIVTSDRGLAGGYNSNLGRAVEKYLAEVRPNHEHIDMFVLGRKGREMFKRKGHSFAGELPAATPPAANGVASELAQSLTKQFLDGEFDSLVVVYNEFKSAISQIVQIDPLLPLVKLANASAATSGEGEATSLIDFDYEPSREAILETILPLYIEVELYRVLLEAIASEFGARMSAMDSATRNAKEMIGSLTLEYNRARQAAITKELMEIVGGSEALKG